METGARCGLPVALAVWAIAEAALWAEGQSEAEAVASPSEPSSGLLPLPDFTGDLGARRYLTGDWGGARGDWARHGVQIGATLTNIL